MNCGITVLASTAACGTTRPPSSINLVSIQLEHLTCTLKDWTDVFLNKNLNALLHCNFLSNLSHNAVARQAAGELHSVTWVVSQFLCCAKPCTK